jgi:hypothetical protein
MFANRFSGIEPIEIALTRDHQRAGHLNLQSVCSSPDRCSE